MSKHVTYRGTTMDMDSLRRENEKVPAIGNMKVNAKGDQLTRGGSVAKTAEQIARENHRVQSVIVNSGLKGPVPTVPEAKPVAPVAKPLQTKPVKTKETELPSGDIIIEGDE